MPTSHEIIGDVEGRRGAQPRQRHVRRELAGLQRKSDPPHHPLFLRLEIEDLRRGNDPCEDRARFASAEGVEAIDGDLQRLTPASFLQHLINFARHPLVDVADEAKGDVVEFGIDSACARQAAAKRRQGLTDVRGDLDASEQTWHGTPPHIACRL